MTGFEPAASKGYKLTCYNLGFLPLTPMNTRGRLPRPRGVPHRPALVRRPDDASRTLSGQDYPEPGTKIRHRMPSIGHSKTLLAMTYAATAAVVMMTTTMTVQMTAVTRWSGLSVGGDASREHASSSFGEVRSVLCRAGLAASKSTRLTSPLTAMTDRMSWPVKYRHEHAIRSKGHRRQDGNYDDDPHHCHSVMRRDRGLGVGVDRDLRAATDPLVAKL